MKFLILVASLGASIQLCLGSNILFLIPMPAKSHYNLGENLIRELINRGHEVTLISPFRMSDPPEKLTEIMIPNLEKKFGQFFKSDDPKQGRFAMRKMSPLSFLLFSHVGEIVFEEAMASEHVREFMKSNQKFDLVIGECFLTEGLLGGFSHKYSAPIVAMSTFIPNTWINELVGNPAPASYVPEPILPYTNEMTLLERCMNFLLGVLAQIVHYNRQIPIQDNLMRKYFGEYLPPLKEMIANTSLVLVNHHHSLGFPRPYLPNMVEVGGYHVKPAQPLSKDLQTFMDKAKDGVILFSMGSNLRSSDFPEETFQEILKVFGKLKQRVLWKFEKENVQNIPKNVKILKWLPQFDLLAHPNTKLLITHGGLLSLTEAVLRGIPIVAIPIFGDQPMNVKFVVKFQIGVRLNYEEITAETLSKAINEVLTNPKYAENAKHRSMLLRDTPMSAMNTALYWIEYVIRHKGAAHLRSTAQDLSWYQLYLLDVYACLAFVMFLFLFIFYCILKALKALFCKKKKVATSPSKKSK